ncbi:hypothetical protein [Wenzhouxiangella limi]|uniref:Uncharacterized protein n=1 Tax=Wenzhouxiangella limi TaxID=2707351 RepID=A0A845V074_9GAMM|nr:hypothetical protein [Wenzhouxiangella limi]NDY95600.1 hypothetical protein [Wenzhouxiangella limi]
MRLILAVFFWSAFVSWVSAEVPTVVAETDQHWIYSDHSMRAKPVLEEPEQLTEAELAQKREEVRRELTAAKDGRAARAESGVPGVWRGFGGVPFGCNGPVDAIERGPGGKIYLGGDFSACNDVVVNNITAWDPATNTFEALGEPAGVDGPVTDLAVAPDGSLIVVGSFIFRAGSEFVDAVARWDGAAWSGVGEGFFNSTINSVVVDPGTGDIIVGGGFTQIFPSGQDPLQVNHIARWDGSAWNVLGDGFNWTVEALELVDGMLFAGGRFTGSGDGSQTFDRIASWDGTQWTGVGGGVDGFRVDSLATNGTELFVGGSFDNAGGQPTGSIAVWDGAAWSGINGPCCIGDLHYADGRLFVTGGFSQVDGSSLPRVAVWDGSNWSTPSNSRFSGFGEAIFSDGGDVFIGGNFSVIGTFFWQDYPDVGTLANRVARFDVDDTEWRALGNGTGNNLNGTVRDLLQYQGELWVAGNFDFAGTRPMPLGVARWDGQRWLRAPVEGSQFLCGVFKDFEVGASGELLGLTSCFSSSGDVVFSSTAQFDGTSWQPLAQGLNGNPVGVEVDPVTGNAYFYGAFTETVGDAPTAVNRIARWDGAAWSSVGEGAENGVSRSTSSFADIDSIAAYDGQIMIEGFFDRAGTTEADGLALWNGEAWVVPGDGLTIGENSGFVSALESQGPTVFAAGRFSTSGAQQVTDIAQWNGTEWLPLEGTVGEGIRFSPRVLSATNDLLYVGGFFSEAGGRPARFLARWDGSDWQSLGEGAENGLARFDGGIGAILPTSQGVFVGGRFGGSSGVTSPNLIYFADPDLIFDSRFEDRPYLE